MKDIPKQYVLGIEFCDILQEPCMEPDKQCGNCKIFKWWRSNARNKRFK